MFRDRKSSRPAAAIDKVDTAEKALQAVGWDPKGRSSATSPPPAVSSLPLACCLGRSWQKLSLSYSPVKSQDGTTKASKPIFENLATCPSSQTDLFVQPAPFAAQEALLEQRPGNAQRLKKHQRIAEPACSAARRSIDQHMPAERSMMRGIVWRLKN